MIPMAARLEFQRSWTVIFAAMVGLCCGGAALPYYIIGVFMDPLTAAFGWSRTEISAWTLCLTMGTLLGAPLMGSIADRIGAKPVAVAAFAVFVLCLLVATQIGGSVGTLWALAVAIGFLTAGSTGVVLTRPVTTWFDTGRGLALGFTLMGASLCGMLAPKIIGHVIDARGWQAGFIAAAAFPLIALPIVAIWLNEQRGADFQAREGGWGLSVRQTTNTPVFWKLGFAFLIFALTAGALIVHLVPLMTDAGISRSSATTMMMWFTGASISGRIVVGFLVDRFFAPFIGAITFAGAALGTLIFATGGVDFILLTVILVGFAIGAEIDLIAFLTSRYFGMKNYGAIYGLLYSMFYIGAGFGPLMFSKIRDYTGDYATGMELSTVLCLVAAYLLWSCRGHAYLEPHSGAEGPGTSTNPVR
jgi:MFS family permease